MERAGVDRAVLVPLSHHDEYVRDCLERFPGRFAAIGVQPPGPRRRRRVPAPARAARPPGAAPVRARRAGGAPTSRDCRCSRSSRATATSSGSTAAASRWSCSSSCSSELPELTVVLNHLGFWPGRFEADEHGRPRFDDDVHAGGPRGRRGLARFPRVHVLLHRHVRVRRRAVPVRRPAARDRGAPRRVRAASGCCSAPTSRGSAPSRATRETLGAVDVAPRRPRRGGAARRSAAGTRCELFRFRAAPTCTARCS